MLAFVILAFLFAFTIVASVDLRANLGDLPMQNPNLFEGDILGINPADDRAIISNPGRKWPDAVVPYIINFSLKNYTAYIRDAMEDFHKNTCVRFKPWDPKTASTRDHIYLVSGLGCYSQVGRIGSGAQSVSLGEGCLHRGTIVHELTHAIGFFHEHSRSDRDKYLNVFWNNIQSGMEYQFRALKTDENILMNDFDYDSIMLYGETAFSKDGRSKTMVSKTGIPLRHTFEKPGLSKNDIFRINTYYNCGNQTLGYPSFHQTIY